MALTPHAPCYRVFLKVLFRTKNKFRRNKKLFTMQRRTRNKPIQYVNNFLCAYDFFQVVSEFRRVVVADLGTNQNFISDCHKLKLSKISYILRDVLNVKFPEKF